jgi:hypothetical protein
MKMKKDQYFNLEVNLLNDDNIACMMSEMNAAEALGIYVMLLLHLRTKDAYEASCKPVLLKAMARRYDVDEVAVERVLREFDLFELDEERQMFRSSYLDRVMKSLEEKRKMDIENGKKGGRPKKVAKSAETPVSKGRKPTENQKRREEESKEEESKGSVSVVNNNRSNIETPSLVSRLADEGNHGPLQPVLPWEKLVDQLSTFQSYMELAGQHSGLGKLFVDHQKLILEIFKKAIIENGMGYDAKDDRLSGNPNQMNIQSMYSDIDLDANDMETELQAAFEDVLWFVNAYLSNSGYGDFEGEEVNIIFNRDILINESEAIDNCAKSVGILSDETIIGMHPWVDDVQKEMDRLEEQKQKEKEEAEANAYNPFAPNPQQQGASQQKGGEVDEE